MTTKHAIPYLGVLFVSRVRYHRNGCAGNGFYAVSFRHGRRQYVAAVFEEPGNVAVLTPDDVAARWRGDNFEGALRDAIDMRREEVHAD